MLSVGRAAPVAEGEELAAGQQRGDHGARGAFDGFGIDPELA
jgi:hypothetical protein